MNRLLYLLAMVFHISDLPPWEGDLGGQLVILLVDIESKSVNTHPQLCSLLVLKGLKHNV